MKKLLTLTSLLTLILIGAQVAPLYAQCVSPPACGGATTQSVAWNGWSFTFRRPCLTQVTTSGGRGGGIEIYNGYFNGKKVFATIHTPILNVRYQNDACGPYRDWQWQESSFRCQGTVVAPGRCNGTAVTNCDTGVDNPGFCGVAVDTSNPSQLVLTTVVSAGWYRYQLEYYFYADGTFHPAVKWTAVGHPCINNTHLHAIYWRMDMDVDAPGGPPNVIEEFNDPPLPDPTYWQTWDPIFVEMARMKDTALGRWWRVRNTTNPVPALNRAYLIYPPEVCANLGLPQCVDGPDGTATPLQIADVWALRYETAAQFETDDCGGPGLCPSITQGWWAHLDRFIDQTSDASYLVGKDIVFWYSATHMHQGAPTPPACSPVNGPYLMPDPSGLAW